MICYDDGMIKTVRVESEQDDMGTTEKTYSSVYKGSTISKQPTRFTHISRNFQFLQYPPTSKGKEEETKSQEDTFQTSSTPTRTSRPKSDAETRSRSSPLPGPNMQTPEGTRVPSRRESKWLHFRASRT
ncbi:uncharacterized protein N7458_004444 [Penicillium daleae]|uniref:Uncharacterized protein n=1 Tax=Penicillium daleae TaxID=63821 RepID=A0AAD6G2Z0_9EURO|nr:uncharacterized protein N7458_004444 [Penicillium daleae]KAJ5453488.1 hypothetical protein N7458_004444 [Penicillium daleae]